MNTALVVGDSLSAYIQKAQLQPVLTEEEEAERARRLREEGDLESAKVLVLSHLRLVISVARGYLGYGLPHSDLIQEGNIGLMKAVKRFDPARGVRLATFALYWIKAEINEYVLRNWRIVKTATTKAQRKLFFNLRKMLKNPNQALSVKETQEIAKELSVKESDVVEMHGRMLFSDVALDEPFDEESARAPIDGLADSRLSPEVLMEKESQTRLENEGVHHALTALDSRSAEIIEARYLAESPKTLQELAQHYAVSAERIRQIEAQALKKMRALLAG